MRFEEIGFSNLCIADDFGQGIATTRMIGSDKKPVWRTVWFAVLGACILLAASLVPVVSNIIAAIDLHGAVILNRAAGVSAILDRIVLLIADEEGRERVIVLALIWFGIALWFTSGRLAKARLVGTFLFITTVLVAFFIIDAMLDDIFIRRSPSYFLTPFHSLGEILNYRVDLKEKRTFPSAEGMILFTMGFILLRLGRVLSALVAIGLGLTVPLLKCVAGLSWLSDIYLGALPISFVISALAVETPYRRVLGTYIDWSAAGFDQGEKFLQNLGPMWRHRNIYWASQNVFHMESAVKRFVAKDLPSIVDPDKHHRDHRPVIEVPLGGLRSVIRIVSLGGVKAVVRAYPVVRRQEAEQHFRASNILTKNSIRVPKLLFYSDSPKKHGAIFLVEEFVDGQSKSPGDLTSEDIKAAAAELAKLHQVKSEVWGPILSPRTEEYGNVLLRRIDRQITQVSRGPVLKGQQSKVAQVRAWFEQWRSELNNIRQFTLIHGKLHRENCIFEKRGGFYLLDITTLEWGVPSSDLVLLHHSQCGGRPELIEEFDRYYRNSIPEADAHQQARLQALYEAFYCLGQVSKYSKRINRGRRQLGDAVNKGMHWWHKLLEIVER